MPPSLGVVIVNYRTAALTVDCLRSLAPELSGLDAARAIVVDNASGDGSAERIAAAIRADPVLSATVSIIAHHENRGFSAGNNVGIRALLASDTPPAWILLLNPDTTVRPGALRKLLECAARHPRAGIVGAQLETVDGAAQRSAFGFPSIWSEFERAAHVRVREGVRSLLSRGSGAAAVAPRARRVGWVSGASLLVRSAVLEDVGSLDEGFFLYYEEVDLCLRAARRGWETWSEPASRIVHLEAQSTQVSFSDAQRPPPAFVLESRRRFFVKNHGVAYAAAADLAWLAGHLAWRARVRVSRRRDPVAPTLLRNFLQHSVLRRGART